MLRACTRWFRTHDSGMSKRAGELGELLFDNVTTEYVVDHEGWAYDLVHRAAERVQGGAVEPIPADERLEPVVVWMDEVTAFTGPGRHVYISRRLLQLGFSEDAAAFVFAHELAHHRLGHVLAEPSAVGEGRWLASMLTRIFAGRLNSPENEAAADRWAIERCLAVGYDRERCLSAFDALGRAALDLGDVDGLFGSEDVERAAEARLRELDGEVPSPIGSALDQARRWVSQRRRGYFSVKERRAALAHVQSSPTPQAIDELDTLDELEAKFQALERSAAPGAVAEDLERRFRELETNAARGSR
jgi:hypothetical protein